jgi:LacI family transcriptional regulator, galactose operon repressor
LTIEKVTFYVILLFMKKFKFKNVLLALGWYSSAMHKGVAEYAREHYWHLDIRYNYRRLLSLKGWQGNGVITSGCELLNTIFKDIKLPIVSMSPTTNKQCCQLVRENDYVIGEIAARHLIKRGFNYFAIYHLDDTSVLRPRKKGFSDYLEKSGFKYIIIPRARGNTAQDEVDILGRSLLKLPSPCAIFCENDLYAHDIIDAAFFFELKIPEDIAVVGVGNDPLICDTTPVTLSSVDNNLELVGYEAAAALDRIMNGQMEIGDPIYIDPVPQVVVRESSDVFSVKNPKLTNILRYMQDNYHSEINIEALANKHYLCKSAMYKLFIRNLKRSPKQILTDIRLEHACRLLRTTSMKIESIAAEVGFPNCSAMYVAFNKYLNARPGDWRNQNNPPAV